MPRLRGAQRTALLEEDGKLPPRVETASKIASREERMEAMTAILRDGRATGAEAVAAARLLENMEGARAGDAQQGIPPPTSRPEQVQRLTRILTAVGNKMLYEALEAICSRSEQQRNRMLRRHKDGTGNLDALKAYRDRIRPRKMEELSGTERNREDQRLGSESSGTAAASDSGVRELYQAAPAIEPSADEDVSDGVSANRNGEEVGGEG